MIKNTFDKTKVLEIIKKVLVARFGASVELVVDNTKFPFSVYVKVGNKITSNSFAGDPAWFRDYADPQELENEIVSRAAWIADTIEIGLL